MKLIETVDQFVEHIRSFPFLALHEVRSNPGATNTDFKAFEQHHRIKLDESIKDFYGQSNGFSFRWSVREDMPGYVLATAQGKAVQYELKPTKDNLEYPTACVKILGLQELSSIDWSLQFFPDDKQNLDFRGKTLTRDQILNDVRVFDECGLFMGAAFCKNFSEVILISDHFTNWNDSIVVSFENYLNFVFSYCGLLNARVDWLLEKDLSAPNNAAPKLDFEFFEQE